MRTKLRLLFCSCLLALFAAACLPKQAPQPRIPSPEEARLAWQQFIGRTSAAEAGSGPFRISASLRYTDAKDESTRVSSILWGNGKVATPYPLRLDLLAGIGSVVAKIRDDGHVFLAFNPKEETAYTRESGNKTLVSFGVPVPLALGDLTLLLTGRAGSLFLPEGITQESPVPNPLAITDAGTRFAMPEAPLPGELELSPQGTPLSWQEAGGNGWKIQFENNDENPMQPKRLRITHPKGYEALVTVRSIEKLDKPFSEPQLALNLPAGTAFKPLGEGQ